MASFICNIMEDGNIRVRINDTLSALKEQEMAIPQGSILVVTLFIIKINKKYHQIYKHWYRHRYDISQVQTYEHNRTPPRTLPNKQAKKNGFKFYKDKIKCIHFCQLMTIYSSLITTRPLSYNQHKYLGIIYPVKMQQSFPTAMSHFSPKLVSRKTLKKLYPALFRSKRYYGCFMSRLARKSYLKELNTIHHQGLRLCFPHITNRKRQH